MIAHRFAARHLHSKGLPIKSCDFARSNKAVDFQHRQLSRLVETFFRFLIGDVIIDRIDWSFTLMCRSNGSSKPDPRAGRHDQPQIGFCRNTRSNRKAVLRVHICVRFPHWCFFYTFCIFVLVHVYTSKCITQGRRGRRVQRPCELGLIFCLITHWQARGCPVGLHATRPLALAVRP